MTNKEEEILSCINNVQKNSSAMLNSIGSPFRSRPKILGRTKDNSAIFNSRDGSLPRLKPSVNNTEIYDEEFHGKGFDPILVDRENLVGVLKKNLLSDNHKLEATIKLKEKYQKTRDSGKKLLHIEKDELADRKLAKGRKISKHKRENVFDERFFGKNGDNISNLKNIVKNFNNYVNKKRIDSLAVQKNNGKSLKSKHSPEKHAYYDEVTDVGLDLYFRASRIHSPTLRRKS